LGLNRLALVRRTLTALACLALCALCAGTALAQAPAPETPAEPSASAGDATDAGAVLDEGLVEDEATSRDAGMYASGEPPADDAADASRFPPASYYDVGFSYQFESDVEGGGDFDMWEAFIDAAYDVDMTERFAFVARFDYRGDVYGFDDAPPDGTNGFPLLQWGVIHTPRVEPLAAFRVGDDWRLYVGPVFDFSFEGGANVRDAFRPGGLVAAEWTIGPDLRAGLGLIVAYDLDSKAYFSPVLILDWNISDALKMHMESWTTRGGELELGWRPLDQLELAGALGFRREYYRLNERVYDADPNPNDQVFDFQPMQISEALVRDRAYTAAVRVSWLPPYGFVKNVFGDLRIDLAADVDFAGAFTIDDASGSKITELDYDAAPGIGLSFRVPL